MIGSLLLPCGFSGAAVARIFCIVLSDKDRRDYLGFAAINTANRNWFGPMGVRRDCRSRGLGWLLVQSAFLKAKENGINSLILPWVNEKETFYRNVIPDKVEVITQRFYPVKSSRSPHHESAACLTKE